MKNMLKIGFFIIGMLLASPMSTLQALPAYTYHETPRTEVQAKKMEADIAARKNALAEARNKKTATEAELAREELLLKDEDLRLKIGRNDIIMQENGEAFKNADTAKVTELMKAIQNARAENQQYNVEIENNLVKISEDNLDGLARLFQESMPSQNVKPRPTFEQLIEGIKADFAKGKIPEQKQEETLANVERHIEEDGQSLDQTLAEVQGITQSNEPYSLTRQAADIEQTTQTNEDLMKVIVETTIARLDAQAELAALQRKVQQETDPVQARETREQIQAQQRTINNIITTEQIADQVISKAIETRNAIVEASTNPFVKAIRSVIEFIKQKLNLSTPSEIVTEAPNVAAETSKALQNIEKLSKNPIFWKSVNTSINEAKSRFEKTAQDIKAFEDNPNNVINRAQLESDRASLLTQRESINLQLETISIDETLANLEKQYTQLEGIHLRIPKFDNETLYEQFNNDSMTKLSFGDKFKAFEIVFSEPVLKVLRESDPAHFNAAFNPKNATSADIDAAYTAYTQLVKNGTVINAPKYLEAYKILSTPISRENYVAYLADAELLGSKADNITFAEDLTADDRNILKNNGRLERLKLNESEDAKMSKIRRDLVSEIGALHAMQASKATLTANLESTRQFLNEAIKNLNNKLGQ